MKLSGEHFQEIIAQLISDHSEGSHDKRREPRVGIRAQGTMTPWRVEESGTRQTRIIIRDLSPGGICILSDAAMQRGTRFILMLPRAQRTALLAHYEVRYSKVLTGKMHAVGAKLVNLTDAVNSAA